MSPKISPPPVPEARREADSGPILAMSLLVAALALVALAQHRQQHASAAPPASKATRAPEPSPGAIALREGRPLDVNTASLADLELLPRIGPAMAARIAGARPFTSVEDLERVRGIGPRTLERLRPLVRVGSPGDGGVPEPSLAPAERGGYQSTSARATSRGPGASR